MRMASEMKNTSNWDYTHCMTVVSLEMSDEPEFVLILPIYRSKQIHTQFFGFWTPYLERGDSLCKADAIAALVRSEVLFWVTATKLTWDTLDDVNGSNFCHDSRFFLVSEWLQNGFCVPSEWYRNSFGIVFRQNGACISKLASAKLQREKGESKFCANLWRFEMLKLAHSPNVYGEKIIFL